MKRTAMEEVTRTFCDVCGKDITHGNRVGKGQASYPGFDYTVCMETIYNVEMPHPMDKDIRLNCEKMAIMYNQYPELANETFKAARVAAEAENVFGNPER